MRAVIQRVSTASVRINGRERREIGPGLLIFLAAGREDEKQDCQWLASKILQMRIFQDDQGKMNRSVQQMGGELLVISQFTLYASTRKGNRPSFNPAADPAQAIPLYEMFLKECNGVVPVKTGEFGADMKVELINDGPVTIIVDSKNKE